MNRKTALKKLTAGSLAVMLLFTTMTGVVFADEAEPTTLEKAQEYVATSRTLPEIKALKKYVTFDDLSLTNGATTGFSPDVANEIKLDSFAELTAKVESDNTYVEMNTTGGKMIIVADSNERLGVNDLVISMKVKMTEGALIRLHGISNSDWSAHNTYLLNLNGNTATIFDGKTTIFSEKTFTDNFHTIDLRFQWEQIDATNYKVHLVKAAFDGEVTNDTATWTRAGTCGKTGFGNLKGMALYNKTANTSSLDNILIYEPVPDPKATFSVANGDYIYADQAVTVTYNKTLETVPATLQKWNGTAFEETTITGTLTASGENTVQTFTGLAADGVYKLGYTDDATFGTQNVVFNTFAKYMPKAKTKLAGYTGEGENKQGYPNAVTFAGSGGQYTTEEITLYGETQKALKIFETTKKSDEIYGNYSTATLADLSGVTDEVVILSYDYDDSAITTLADNDENFMSVFGSKTLSDERTNFIFRMNYKGSWNAIAGAYSGTISDYAKGRHRLEMMLTGSGIQWLMLDGKLIGTNMVFGDKMISGVKISDSIDTVDDYGDLKLFINQRRSPEGTDHILFDNMMIYSADKPGKASVVKATNATVEYDTYLQTNWVNGGSFGTATAMGNGKDNVAIPTLATGNTIYINNANAGGTAVNFESDKTYKIVCSGYYDINGNLLDPVVVMRGDGVAVGEFAIKDGETELASEPAVPADGTANLTISAKFANVKEAAPCRIIAAQYNDNVLVKATVVDATSALDTASKSFNIEGINEKTELKLFFWENASIAPVWTNKTYKYKAAN